MPGRVWLMVMLTVLSAGTAAASAAGQRADVERFCAMLHSLDDGERETARAELVKIGLPAVGPVVAVLAKDAVYLGREGAAFVLGRIADPCAVKPLVSALEDEYAAVRDEASLALARIGGPKTVDAVLAALGRGGGDAFLEAAASTLGLLGDKRALAALARLEKSPDRDVAKAAAQAAERLRSGSK
jgi:bilin biosynthesis protein